MRELIDVEMLRALRKARSLSQAALANLAGIDRTVVARLERGGQQDVRLSVFVGLARALDVSIAKLVKAPPTDHPAPAQLTPELVVALAALDTLPPALQTQLAAIINAYLATIPERAAVSPTVSA